MGAGATVGVGAEVNIGVLAGEIGLAVLVAAGVTGADVEVAGAWVELVGHVAFR